MFFFGRMGHIELNSWTNQSYEYQLNNKMSMTLLCANFSFNFLV